MITTYTQVDGQTYQGKMFRGPAKHPTRGDAFHSYLSADLGGGNYIHVEIWDRLGDKVTPESALRAALEQAIRRKAAA